MVPHLRQTKRSRVHAAPRAFGLPGHVADKSRLLHLFTHTYVLQQQLIVTFRK